MDHKIGVIAVVLWITYALPFIHLIPYLWFNYDSSPPLLWGLAVNPYMVDKQVIETMAIIGAMGALGITFALLIHGKPKKYAVSYRERPYGPSLSIPMTLMWSAIGITLSWLNAPVATIFEEGYGVAATRLDGANLVQPG